VLSSGAHGIVAGKVRLTRLKGGTVAQVIGHEVTHLQPEHPPSSALLELKEGMRLAREKMMLVEVKQAPVFVKHMVRTKEATLFRLSNGLIQAVFAQHKAIVIHQRQYYFLVRRKIQAAGEVRSEQPS
jgi:hypothetical protein